MHLAQRFVCNESHTWIQGLILWQSGEWLCLGGASLATFRITPERTCHSYKPLSGTGNKSSVQPACTHEAGYTRSHYPNQAKILHWQGSVGAPDNMGSPDMTTGYADFETFQITVRRDYTLRKGILWNLDSATEAEALRKGSEMIRLYRSKNPNGWIQ